MSDEDEAGFALVMPFVVCKTQGGPYDDAAFTSGYRIGQLDARLEYERPAVWEGYIAPEDQPQVDLVAMRYGYKAVFTKYSDDWTSAALTKAEDPDV